MTQILLDTNIISELGKAKPQQSVTDFLADLPVAWLSTITLHELEYGLALLPEGNRKKAITDAISTLVKNYSHNILSIKQEEAQQAALLRVLARKNGKTLHLADSLIAGTAQVHNLMIATRNTKDFDNLGIKLINPFIL
ncbi:MAG TPA: type II toxin-antitoxin system VapC family toxin [Thiothrix sp.]|nr:type II toxin-antitoxin system VapC family toxin [Thiothrix sp.]